MSCWQFTLNNLNMVCFIYAICFHAFTKCILFCFILKRNAIHVRRRHRRRSAVNFSQYENCIFMKYDLKRIWFVIAIKMFVTFVLYFMPICFHFFFILFSCVSSRELLVLFFLYSVNLLRLNFRKTTTDKQCKTMHGIHLIKMDFGCYCYGCCCTTKL